MLKVKSPMAMSLVLFEWTAGLSLVDECLVAAEALAGLQANKKIRAGAASARQIAFQLQRVPRNE